MAMLNNQMVYREWNRVWIHVFSIQRNTHHTTIFRAAGLGNPWRESALRMKDGMQHKIYSPPFVLSAGRCDA